ncbi:SMI1/KNR4 family protein [Paenibacillus sp. FSL K6-1318]|uniref:SMI1/KNR4 family protein n=1 Tax=Paenibacillus sp. FSL K6-1318 TaxID=2975291 RepID=UPI0030EE3880
MDCIKDGNIKIFLSTLEENSYPMKACNEDDILKLKNLSPTKELPLTYLRFMYKSGNGIEFLAGTDYTMKYILELKEFAVELLDENNFSEKLTDNQFVFMMHQGYMFWYFNLDEGDNPAVYLYDESLDLTKFKKVSDTLSEFLISLYD